MWVDPDSVGRVHSCQEGIWLWQPSRGDDGKTRRRQPSTSQGESPGTHPFLRLQKEPTLPILSFWIFQPPEWGESKFLVFKPRCLWYCYNIPSELTSLQVSPYVQHISQSGLVKTEVTSNVQNPPEANRPRPFPCPHWPVLPCSLLQLILFFSGIPAIYCPQPGAWAPASRPALPGPPAWQGLFPLPSDLHQGRSRVIFSTILSPPLTLYPPC